MAVSQEMILYGIFRFWFSVIFKRFLISVSGFFEWKNEWLGGVLLAVMTRINL